MYFWIHHMKFSNLNFLPAQVWNFFQLILLVVNLLSKAPYFKVIIKWIQNLISMQFLAGTREFLFAPNAVISIGLTIRILGKNIFLSCIHLKHNIIIKLLYASALVYRFHKFLKIFANSTICIRVINFFNLCQTIVINHPFLEILVQSAVSLDIQNRY